MTAVTNNKTQSIKPLGLNFTGIFSARPERRAATQHYRLGTVETTAGLNRSLEPKIYIDRKHILAKGYIHSLVEQL